MTSDPIRLTERGSTTIDEATLTAIRRTAEFRSLLDSGVIKVQVESEGATISAGDFVGSAKVGTLLEIVVGEKIPGSLDALYRAADQVTFRLLEAIADYPRLADIPQPLWFRIRTWDAFLKLAADYVRQGLDVTYREHSRPRGSPRGKILIQPTLSLRARGVRSRVMCRSPELSHDLPLNRLVKLALLHLADRHRIHARTAARASRLMTAFGDVPRDEKYYGTHWLAVVRDATGLADPVARLASAVLRDVSLSSLAAGGIELPFATFVRLWDLFEDAIHAGVRAAVAEVDGWAVSRKESPAGVAQLLKGSGGDKLMKLEPDVVLSLNGKPKLVIDAKYKVLTGDLSHSDVYQVITHARGYGATEAWLISLREMPGGKLTRAATAHDGIELRWIAENPIGLTDRVALQVQQFMAHHNRERQRT